MPPVASSSRRHYSRRKRRSTSSTKASKFRSKATAGLLGLLLLLLVGSLGIIAFTMTHDDEHRAEYSAAGLEAAPVGPTTPPVPADSTPTVPPTEQ